jgi:hypothetical protein
MSMLQGPMTALDTGAARRYGAAWLAHRSAGMLRTRVAILLGLALAPWLTTAIYVEPVVRGVAVLLTILHAACALYLQTVPDDRRARSVARSEVAADALGCGILLGATGSIWGAALPLAVVALVLAREAGGSRLLLGASVVMLACAGATAWRGVGTTLVMAPRLVIPTMLGIETSFGNGRPAASISAPLPTLLDVDETFAGEAATPAAPVAFASTLRVDTTFRGVSAFQEPERLFVPALGLATFAICIGSGASLIGMSSKQLGVDR